MTRFRLFGLTLVAVFAFSALAVATASAVLTFEPALFLLKGNDITAAVPVTAKGGILLENVLNKGAILCEGEFDGTISATGELLEITKLLFKGVEVAELDETGATGGIKCVEEEKKICATESEVWVGKLPWDINPIEDPEGPLWYLELLTAAEYSILCLVGTVSINELCVAQVGTLAEQLNVAGGLEAVGAGSLLATCNGNTEEGLLQADPGNLLSANNGEVIAISLNAEGK